MNIPKEHQRLMPYFILKGAEKFINFTTAVFGAELIARHQQEGGEGIMHAEIRIGETVIMFAEATEQWPPQTGSIFIYVENADSTYATALREGAVAVMEPADKGYGRSGGVKDPTGVTWWITSL